MCISNCIIEWFSQRSAQFLLNGLHEQEPDATFHDRNFKHYEENGNQLPIFVSEQTHCPLTFYERNLDLTVKLVNKVSKYMHIYLLFAMKKNVKNCYFIFHRFFIKNHTKR